MTNAHGKKIVVTGAKGQLGGELCRMLGDRAVPIDIDTLDLTDRQATLDRLHTKLPDLIINCAAYTQVDKAESEPDLARAVNVSAVENLAEYCEQEDCSLVQISTDYVFGEGGRGKAEEGVLQPWTEEDAPAPQSVYARTKLEGERAAAKWEKHIIVRTCGLYARPSDENARNFVKTMLRLAETKLELRVVNDQHCTPSYVPHVARAILFLAGLTSPLPTNLRLVPGEAPGMMAASMSAASVWGIYHVTNRGETTWYDFTAEILRLAKKSVPLVPITAAEFAAPAARPFYSVLNTSKYHSLAGPEMPDWKDGLREYFAER